MPKSGESTRRALLDAANRIVQERGVDRLTLDLTAQEAGVSKGALLYHFPNKEALIKGMIQDYLARFTDDFNRTANQDGEPAPGRWTRSYLYTTYEDNQRTPRMSSGLLAAVATNPTLLAPMQQTFAEWVKLLEKDGIDPTVAMIIRLAVDGLWMVELFGLAPPDPELREKVLHALDGWIERQAGEDNPKVDALFNVPRRK
jgi:AcrR family transcriptional regulator